jgi:TM2 domain-containing membrane protein YozV
MYCSKCGNEIALGDDYCSKCGQRSGNSGGYRSQGICERGKSEGGAAVLSLLWGGLGQIYVGRIARGLGIMLAYFLIGIGCWAFLVGAAISGSFAGLVFIGFVMTIVLIVLLIWNVFDAYNLAKQYNDSLRSTGNRPW